MFCFAVLLWLRNVFDDYWCWLRRRSGTQMLPSTQAGLYNIVTPPYCESEATQALTMSCTAFSLRYPGPETCLKPTALSSHVSQHHAFTEKTSCSMCEAVKRHASLRC
jgi:hypothetical protein